MGLLLQRYRRDPRARRARRGRGEAVVEPAQVRGPQKSTLKGGALMPFKDVSELHLAASAAGEPAMFERVLEAAVWSTKMAPSSANSTLSITLKGCGDGGVCFSGFSYLVLPGPDKFLCDPLLPELFPFVVYGAGGSAKSLVA